MKTKIILLIKFAISIVILGYLIKQAIADEQFKRLAEKDKDWLWLAAGFLCSIMAIAVSTFRWRLLVKSLGLPLTLRDAFKIGFMGQFFHVFAFGTLGADTIRAFYLARKFNKQKSLAISTVLADRFSGLLTMFFLAAIAFFLLERMQLIEVKQEYRSTLQSLGRVIPVLAAIGTVLVAVVVLIPRIEGLAWFQRLCRIPRVGHLIKMLLSLLSVYQSRPGIMFVSLALSVLVNVFFCLAIFLIAHAITDDRPSLVNHFFIEPISMVCNAIPLPGGIGGMEFALSMLYKIFGSSSGVIVAFTFRLSLLCVASIGGITWLLNRKELGELQNATPQIMNNQASENPQ